MTEPFGDKTDVVAKHWKTHVAEERSDIVSELACMGLAHLEEWHYSAFDSSGTCSLGLISTESIPNPTGKVRGLFPKEIDVAIFLVQLLH